MTEKKNIRIIIQLISKQYGNDRRKSDRNDNDRVQYRNRNPGADGDVWLTPSEIARMFEVFVSAVTSNIRAIYKHGALRMSETSNLPTAHAELYNLEMISALAFRVDTPQSAAFRRWLIRRPHSRMVVLKVSQVERTVVN